MKISINQTKIVRTRARQFFNLREKLITFSRYFYAKRSSCFHAILKPERSNQAEVEAQAREEHNMVKEGEDFIQVVEE